MIRDKKYEIRKISPDDKEQIRTFIAKYYIPYDPAMQAMNVSVADEYQMEHMLEFIGEDYSYAVVADDGEILAILLCGEVNTNSLVHLNEEKITCKSKHFLKLLDFYEEIIEGSDVHRVMGYEKALETHIAAVKPDYRCCGLMKKLLRTVIEKTKSKFNMFICTCNSKHMAKLVQSLSFECIYCLPFSHFKDSDGCRLFTNPVAPHLHLQMYCKIVPNTPVSLPPSTEIII